MSIDKTTENSGLLRKLYPLALNYNVKLPSCWNAKDKHNYLKLSHENCRAQYKGPGKTHKDAAAIRSDHCIPNACGIFYFEVTIISSGLDGYIGVGLSEPGVSLNRLPGWEKQSYGYHGDDGHIFSVCGSGNTYGPTYGKGDVVGCGLNLEERTCFFTINGCNLGTAFSDLPANLFPIIGLQTPGEIVHVNFGQTPFVYEIKRDIEEMRCRTLNMLHNIKLPEKKLDWLRSLIGSYLSYHAYPKTAAVFSRVHDVKIEESKESMCHRRSIKLLILQGEYHDAIAMINIHYPKLLKKDLQLRLLLMCSFFAELFAPNSSERHVLSEDDFPQSLFPKLDYCFSERDLAYSSSNSSSASELTASSETSSEELFPNYNANPVGVGQPSNGRAVAEVYESEDSAEEELSNLVSPQGGLYCNGASAEDDPTPPTPDDDGDDKDDVPDAERTTTNGSTSAHPSEDENEIASSQNGSTTELTEKELQKCLHFSHDITALGLFLQANKLLLPELKTRMKDALALMGYKDAASSPFAYVFDQDSRANVSVIVNSAIMQYQGGKQFSELEYMFKYAGYLRKLLKDANVAAAAFLEPREFLTGEYLLDR